MSPIRAAGFIALMLMLHATNAASAPLLPDAAYIRVVGAPNAERLFVDHNGHVRAQRWTDAHERVGVPITDGGRLTANEAASLTTAVGVEPPNPAGGEVIVSACCDPRHAFLFYDSGDRFLGYLSVCFECGCTNLWPAAGADSEPSWDEKAVGSIVLAHRLGPLAPRRTP
jgi:hypothetical protein